MAMSASDETLLATLHRIRQACMDSGVDFPPLGSSPRDVADALQGELYMMLVQGYDVSDETATNLATEAGNAFYEAIAVPHETTSK
jgi:hypothetical protein